MVYFEDTGTVLDAPIEIVWEYLRSDEHGPAHQTTLRNIDAHPLNEITVQMNAERNWNGRWERFVTRTTEQAPLCILNKELEGTLAGSAMLFLYAPMGPRTRVDVYADLASESIPVEQLLREVPPSFDDAYRDDERALRRFATGRSSDDSPLFVSDEGSLFDAPLSTVWRYLMEGEAHDGVHTTTRKGTFEPLPGGSLLYSCERALSGRWTRETTRITPLRPVAIASEWLEGPLAGSKSVYRYRARGDRTEVDAYGQFSSSTIPRDRLAATAKSIWEIEYAEDSPAIRDFAAKSRATA